MIVASFPKNIANKAIILYCILLFAAPMIFGYPMEWFGYIWGLAEILLFFYFGRLCFLSNKSLSDKAFAKRIFWIAFVLRVAYVFISYWFYTEMSDKPPFEFRASDSWYYDLKASNSANLLFKKDLSYILEFVVDAELSDSGFVTYLMFIYYIFGDASIVITRLLNAFFSAYTIIFIFKIANRHFDTSVAKIVAIFCAFMPNFIFYCGLHLKEVIMVFLVVLYINSADVIILENKKWQKWASMVLAGLALFTFRTVLGAVALLAFFTTLLFTSGKTMGWSKRIIILIAALGVLSVVIGDRITSEVEAAWNDKGESQQISLEWRSKRKGGNEFAKYAGAAVFVPLIFTIPFPTLVQTPDQENMRLINGGNYVKNIMSFFTISAIIMMILSGEWRKHVLILSYTLGYLVVIAFSSFAQSERFHQPVLPFELMLAAYGIILINTKKGKKWFNVWLVFIFATTIGWQWFKLAGRGML